MLVVSGPLLVVGLLLSSADATPGSTPLPATMVFDPLLGPAVCEDVEKPWTCVQPPSFADLEAFDGTHQLALCTWDQGTASDCFAVAARCCDTLYGATWLDSCWPLAPGILCDGWGTPVVARAVE